MSYLGGPACGGASSVSGFCTFDIYTHLPIANRLSRRLDPSRFEEIPARTLRS